MAKNEKEIVDRYRNHYALVLSDYYQAKNADNKDLLDDVIAYMKKELEGNNENNRV